MRLYEALREECVSAGHDVPDKTAALRAVAQCAKKSGLLADVDENAIVRGLDEREALGSTGFGNGIAIPHCRLEGVKDFVVGILTVPGGVEFDAFDGKPVTLIVFVIAPEDSSDTHIRLLSAISQTLHGKRVVEEIVAGSSSAAVRESFLRHGPTELDTEGRRGKRVIFVFIQEEDLFHEILEVFTVLEGASAVALNSENLQAHLAKIPLFQGLWTHEPGGFSNLIVAVVDEGLTNEMVRQIETRTGDLDKRSGVMLVIQDVFYTAGSLVT